MNRNHINFDDEIKNKKYRDTYHDDIDSEDPNGENLVHDFVNQQKTFNLNKDTILNEFSKFCYKEKRQCSLQSSEIVKMVRYEYYIRSKSHQPANIGQKESEVSKDLEKYKRENISIKPVKREYFQYLELFENIYKKNR